MIRQHKTSESITAIAGGALVGLGLHILSGSHDTAADQFLGNTAGDALGVLPCVVLAAWQALQTCAFDHGRLLQGLLPMLVSCWPLLLVVVGTVVLWDVFADQGKASPTPNQYFPKNAFKNKDTGSRFHWPSFDV